MVRCTMRGYFGIGVEQVSKPFNMGNLFRSAHAFGASFVFTVDAAYQRASRFADTADTPSHLPFYSFPDAAHLLLPHGCRLVGVELLDEAVAMPTFRHPPRAAYILGRERGALSDAVLARCDHVIRIPVKFSINVAVTGALVMYDRMLSRGGFQARPMRPGGPAEAPPEHHHGDPVRRTHGERATAFRDTPPLAEADAVDTDNQAEAALSPDDPV